MLNVGKGAGNFVPPHVYVAPHALASVMVKAMVGAIAWDDPLAGDTRVIAGATVSLTHETEAVPVMLNHEVARTVIMNSP